MIENPPWVNRILSDNWSELSKVVEPSMLPHTTQLARSSRRKITPGSELGCGHYGCVLKTDAPGIVCKITSDPSEALFVEMAWQRLGRTRQMGWPEGIVQYHKIIALEGEHKNRPVWMLWRDEAWNVGGADRLILYGGRNLDYDLRELKNGLGRLDQFKFYAHAARLMINKTPSTLPEGVKLWKDGDLYDYVAGELLQEEEHPASNWSNRGVDFSARGFRGARRLAANLQAAQNVVQNMANEPGLYEIGQALETFLEHGMLLADVHHQNIGQPSPDAGIREWIITDPGHLAVLW